MWRRAYICAPDPCCETLSSSSFSLCLHPELASLLEPIAFQIYGVHELDHRSASSHDPVLAAADAGVTAESSLELLPVAAAADATPTGDGATAPPVTLSRRWFPSVAVLELVVVFQKKGKLSRPG